MNARDHSTLNWFIERFLSWQGLELKQSTLVKLKAAFFPFKVGNLQTIAVYSAQGCLWEQSHNFKARYGRDTFKHRILVTHHYVNRSISLIITIVS